MHPVTQIAPGLAGIPELVKLLQSRGQAVFLVSGGFRQIIHPLAERLDIPLANVFANSILFDVCCCLLASWPKQAVMLNMHVQLFFAGEGQLCRI